VVQGQEEALVPVMDLDMVLEVAKTFKAPFFFWAFSPSYLISIG